jgi:glyoxylase I family protein
MLAAHFAHIALNCRDQAAIENFYSRYFGFTRARVIDLGPEQIIFLKSGDCYLELFQAKGEPPFSAPSNDGPAWAGVRHVAFQVENVNEKLAELGEDAHVKLGPLSFDDFIPGWRTAWVADPEGNIVEITQGFKDEERLVAQAELACSS